MKKILIFVVLLVCISVACARICQIVPEGAYQLAILFIPLVIWGEIYRGLMLVFRDT